MAAKIMKPSVYMISVCFDGSTAPSFLAAASMLVQDTRVEKCSTGWLALKGFMWAPIEFL